MVHLGDNIPLLGRHYASNASHIDYNIILHSLHSHNVPPPPLSMAWWLVVAPSDLYSFN